MSLDNAMRAFIRSGGDRTVMLVPLWAQTYSVSVESVRLAWERIAATESQQPSNSFDEGGEGK